MGTWDDIDENWDLLRYERMQEYWSTVAPPLDIMAAAYLGWKPERRIKPDSRKGDLGDLMALFGGTGGVIN